MPLHTSAPLATHGRPLVNASFPRRIVGFSGNTHRPSKTHALVSALLTAAGGASDVETRQYDVLDFGAGLANAFSRDQLSSEAVSILQDIETADGLILASPTYKGSYSGLFKHIIDLLEPDALAHKPVIIAGTGGGLRHALMVEHQLRPLMGFFNASTIATSVYASDGEFENGVPSAEPLKLRILDAGEGLARLIRGRTDLPSSFTPANGGPTRTT